MPNTLVPIAAIAQMPKGTLAIPFTEFWDMHSGGGAKEDWEHIFIEAPEAEARVIFYNTFGHSPDRVTCTCCGQDYAVDEFTEAEDLVDRLNFHFGGDYPKPLSSLRVIRAHEIPAEKRLGTVPRQGYVWQE